MNYIRAHSFWRNCIKDVMSNRRIFRREKKLEKQRKGKIGRIAFWVLVIAITVVLAGLFLFK
jgi:hypothetical protein